MNDIEYKAIHFWVSYYYGKAHRCNNIKCPRKCLYYEWSNISGEYKKDISDWEMLCISCHRRKDYWRNNGNKCKKGHEFTPENTYIWSGSGRRKCKICIKNSSVKYIDYYRDYWKNKRKRK